ncbi:excitatory amino acid transporter-like isoform X2 [Varroa jacobsoni]|uniref:Amino acid transporter n=1 Tax=Varroa destructor TaxID=109461 RepID=A0A7M7J1Z6_VARDE|nr:excitatory amino acid transporter-like isoform X2 [Varroa destructor]XP_022709243.1 excitatory amino acid transporter-like isoform X2 [Varroa jacobsoni]XP_022709245.1 excitatory amino acid transporter-like isoform X2 [Varroa jacobsoni]
MFESCRRMEPRTTSQDSTIRHQADAVSSDSDMSTIVTMIATVIRKNFFLVTTVFGVIAGIVLGVALRSLEPSVQMISFVELPGEVFMRCLRLLILPMMIATIVSGSANLSGKAQGKMALLTLSIFMLTSLISALIGLCFVTAIYPGRDMSGLVGEDTSRQQSQKTPTLTDTFLDLIRNAFPENLIEATTHSGYSAYQSKNQTQLDGSVKEISKRVWHVRGGTNSLGLIVFCIAFGSTIGSMGTPADPLKHFFSALDSVIMKLVGIVMWFTPVGVCSLLCARILEAGDILLLFHQMALFILTVVSALSVELFGVQPILYFVLTRGNPFKLLLQLAYPGMCAFVCAASAPVMPLMLRALEDKCGVDKRVAKFVIPIGVTVNMNGTACFIAAATMFIAQMNNISLELSDYFAVLITSTAVSIAATSVPSAALFLMAMTLSVIGAPLSDVSLLFTTEWLLDRCRTVNNCLGDGVTAAIVSHLCDLKGEPDDDNGTDCNGVDDGCLDEKKSKITEDAPLNCPPV